MGRPATGKTFIARIRIKKTKWDAAEKDAEVVGADRSKLVNEFLDWIAADPELWRDVRFIATKRQELVGSVLLAAFSRYRARHRDLLPGSGPPVAEARQVLLDEAERQNQ